MEGRGREGKGREGKGRGKGEGGRGREKEGRDDGLGNDYVDIRIIAMCIEHALVLPRGGGLRRLETNHTYTPSLLLYKKKKPVWWPVVMVSSLFSSQLEEILQQKNPSMLLTLVGFTLDIDWVWSTVGVASGGRGQRWAWSMMGVVE